MTSQWSIHYLQPDLQVTYTPQSESHSVVSDSFRPYGLYSPWNSLGQNTGVGSCSLLQGIFPTQGLNPDLKHWRQILYQLSHKGSPGILQWVAYPFSSRSSWPRNRTGVSCIAGGFFTNWATREALFFLEDQEYWQSLNSRKTWKKSQMAKIRKKKRGHYSWCHRNKKKCKRNNLKNLNNL